MAASTWRMPIVRINTVSSTQPFMPAMKRSSVLPHELVVEITGGEVSDVDVVTQ